MLLITSVGLQKTEEKTQKMILAGAEVIRFNFSRHTVKQNIELIQTVQNVADELHSATKILIDMPISKTRIGDFDIKTFAVRIDEEFICKSAPYSPDCNLFIPINITKLGEKVRQHQVITIGDGEIATQVIEIIDSETIKIKILNNGIFQYMKTVNIGQDDSADRLMNNYQTILNQIQSINYHYIAVSYISPEINEKIKQLKNLKQNSHVKIIIKIENLNGIKDVASILNDPFYDLVLLDRGELGVNLPFEQVGIVQRQLIDMCKRQGKRLIISTQILESTINNYTPNRAEISDLTNMVIDGAYGIMFCRETGINTRPAYTISVAKKIIDETERYQNKIVI